MKTCSSTSGRAVLLSVLLGSMAAGLLHLIPQRSDAAWVVPLIIIWGGVVSSTARGEIRSITLFSSAILIRLIHVGATPTLSDDLYRFLFEGVALNHGYNPFTSPPMTLTHLDPWLASHVNHPDIPSIYPPTAQWWFRLLAALGARPWTAQLLTAAVDVLNVALLFHILKQRAQATWPALIYALHPLPVLESAHGAHLEALGVFFCFATISLLDRKMPLLAALSSALGVGVKLIPALFVPSLSRQLSRNQTITVGVLGTMLLVGLAAPVLDAGPQLFAALQTYSAHWSFNGLIYPLLQPMFRGYTRPLLALCGVGVALRASFLPARHAWLTIGVSFLFLSPTVHPWYVLWAFAPALLLHQRQWAFAAISLQCSYLVLGTLDDTGAWAPPWWLGIATWGPALISLSIPLVQDLKDAKPTVP